MKKFRKIMAVLVAAMMIIATMVPAWADVTITVHQDASDSGVTTDTGRVMKAYKIFSASYVDGTYTGNTNSSEATFSTGTGDALELSGDTTNKVAYTATPAIAALLGNVDNGTKAWTAFDDDSQPWFTLTYVPGTGNYNVRPVDANLDTAEKIQTAAQWLFNTITTANAVNPTTLQWNENPKTWTATVDEGYYVIESNAGKNLIAATTNIDIKEKNAYPVLTKTQKDIDDDTDFTSDPIELAIEDQVTYNVNVTIPKTAKVGDKIKVWDTKSSGLTWTTVACQTNPQNASVSTATGDDIVSGATWTQIIEVTNANQLGTTLVFTCTMTVNSDTLTDTSKSNTTGLFYGRVGYPYESVPVQVIYKTYFAGINKVDTAGAKLADVEFTLKENGTPYKVKKPTGEDYYIPDKTNGSEKVVTDSDGHIRIRGIDSDKTYTLTETKTNDGYYVLETPVTLTLHEDITAKYTKAVEGAYSGSQTYYKLDNGAYVEETVDDDADYATKLENLYTKDNDSDTYAKEDADSSSTAFTTVTNYFGSTLPATGGMGTTVLYIVGGMLIVLAGAYLFFSRKRTA